MQPAIDRVLSALMPHRTVTERQSEGVRDDAAQFAARLLDTYKAQLAQRSLATNERPQS
jgi:hypothetical protein